MVAVFLGFGLLGNERRHPDLSVAVLDMSFEGSVISKMPSRGSLYMCILQDNFGLLSIFILIILQLPSDADSDLT